MGNYFENKNIVITGGSSGIGLQLARELTKKGGNILLIARNEENLKKAVEEVSSLKVKSHQKIDYLSLDVGDAEAVEKKLPEAVKKFGPPDILINNAGISAYANYFEKITYQQFDRVVKTNFYGVRNVTYALYPLLIERKGHIVIVSSAAAFFGMPGYTAYAATKAALNIFAESLRYEAKIKGVTVTVICPPEVDTPLVEKESKTLPPEAKVVKKLVGTLNVEYTVRKMIKGIEKKKFCVIIGGKTKLSYFFHRLTNGTITRIVADFVLKGNIT